MKSNSAHQSVKRAATDKKVIDMVRLTIVLCALVCSQLLSAQKNSKKADECILSMDIPSRLLKISSDDKEIVYRDKKTNAILTFTKAGITDYDFNLEFTANQVYNELAEDPTYMGAELQVFTMPFTDVFVVDWTRSKVAPNRKNNFNTMAMMNVCGQYYNFTFTMPKGKREDVLPMFQEILTSIEKEKNR